MRRKTRPAISSIHDKPPSPKQRMVNVGGWALLMVAFAVLGIGLYGLYKVMTDATAAQLQVVGTSSDVENRQLVQHIQPIMLDNYFTSDLEQIRDQALQVSWVDRVVVSRAWPNSIRVRVMPRHAIARIALGNLHRPGHGADEAQDRRRPIRPQRRVHADLVGGATAAPGRQERRRRADRLRRSL